MKSGLGPIPSSLSFLLHWKQKKPRTTQVECVAVRFRDFVGGALKHTVVVLAKLILNL